MTRAAATNERKNLAVRYFSESVESSKQSIIQIYLARMVRAASKYDERISDRKVRLLFGKCSCMVRVYTLTMRNGALERTCQNTGQMCEKASLGTCYRQLWAPGDKIGNCMVVTTGWEESGAIWVPEVLILFRIGVRERRKGRWHAFVQHAIMTLPTDMVEVVLEWVCWTYCIDNGGRIARD